MGIKTVIQLKYLIFGEYAKVRESLHTCITNWVNIILNHIDTRIFLPMCEGSYILYTNSIKNTNIVCKNNR